MEKSVKIHLLALSAVLLIFVVGVRMYAQGTIGTILGTVTDSSGSVIPGAKVQVTNTGTNATQTATSDAQGRYRIQALPVGQYDVQSDNMGFQTVIHRGVTLDAGENAVVDFALPVGQVAQTVVVEAEVTRVETTSSALGSVVEPTQMRELPLNGRNFEELILLAPGVNVSLNPRATRTSFTGFSEYWSVSGSRPNGQGQLLDGTNIQNYQDRGSGSGILGTTLGVDAIAQFQMLTNTYGAQYGGNGSVMNAVSRSGTNALHGSGYGFFRNSALDARNFGEDEKQPFKQSQYGGTLGGPIKTDKMFFFANYEGLRRNRSQTDSVVVPNANAHLGLLPIPAAPGTVPALCTVVGAPAGLMNCGPGSPNAANFAKIKPYLDLYPISTGTLSNTINSVLDTGYGTNVDLGDLADLGNGTAQTTVSAASPGNENYVLGRYDWTMSDKDSLFTRYVFDNGSLTDGSYGAWAQWPEYGNSRNQFLTIGQKHIFSNSIINSVQAAGTRTFFFIRSYSLTPTSTGANPLPGALNWPGDLWTGLGAPVMDGTLSPGSGITAIGPDQKSPYRYAQNKISFSDDVFWTKGSHSFRFGFNATKIQTNGVHPFPGSGTWSFSNLTNFLQAVPSRFNGPCNYSNSAPSCVLPSGQPLAFPSSSHDSRETQFAMYIQDDWNVRPNFTLNIGLRYAPTTNPTDSLNQIYALLPVPYGGNTDLPPALSTVQPDTFTPLKNFIIHNPSLHNFDPRIGLAWDPFADHKTSVRAGYGIFHAVLQARDYTYGAFFGYPWSIKSDTAAAALATFPLPFQVPTKGTISMSHGVHPYNMTTPYMQQWNLAIQREVMKNTVLTVAYVGSYGVHLGGQRDSNPPLASGLPGAVTINSGETLWPTASWQKYVVTSGAGTVAANGNVTCTVGPCQLASANGQPFVNPTTGQKQYGHDTQTAATRFTFAGNSRWNPNFSFLELGATDLYSHYNGLQIGVVRRMTNGLSAQFSYTYSSCMDISSGFWGQEGGESNSDPYNVRADRGPCSFQVRHSTSTNATYAFPFKGNKLVEGWQLTGIYYYSSGGNFNIGSIGPLSNDDGGSTSRPDLVLNAPGCNGKPVNDNPVTSNGVWYLNPACYAIPAPGELGNLPRNNTPGPNSTTVNISLQKATRITERLNLQVRAEMFNAFNRKNFDAPSVGFTQGATSSAATVVTGTATPTFGQITSTRSPAREVQLGFKLIF